MYHATGKIVGKSWDERPFHLSEDGKKLTQVKVTNSYQGELKGEGTLEYLTKQARK